MAEWCVVESCSEWSTNGSLASLNPDNQTRLSSNPHLDKCSDVFSDPLDCSVSWESSAHTFSAGFEWFGSFGEVSQNHQYYPTTDLRLGDDVTLHLGVGFGGTSAGDRLVFKTRFEMPFGGEKN